MPYTGNVVKATSSEMFSLGQHDPCRNDATHCGTGICTPIEDFEWDGKYGFPGMATNPHHRHDAALIRQPDEVNPIGLVGPSFSFGHILESFTPGTLSPIDDYTMLHQVQDLSNQTNELFAHSRSMENSNGYPPGLQVQTPTSPQLRSNLMSKPTHDSRVKPSPRNTRSESDRSAADLFRRDGVRKRNARVDIPAERNVYTIEELIDTCEDDVEMKELKAQKRLLRNREAALLSRQRKKRHTEDLEVREKRHLYELATFEKDKASLARRCHTSEQQSLFFYQQYEEADGIVQSLKLEREQLVGSHAQEVASLHAKIQQLLQDLEISRVPGISTTAVSTASTEASPGLNSMSRDIRGAGINSHHHAQVVSHGHLSNAEPVTNDSTGNQSAISDALFMLLLLGAYFASGPGRPPRSLSISSKIRAMSNMVLSTVLGEQCGLTIGQALVQSQSCVDRFAPTDDWHYVSTAVKPLDLLTNPIALASISDHLDQVFVAPAALNQASCTAPGFAGSVDHSITNNATTGRYSTLLLSKPVPASVVKRFKGMMSEESKDKVSSNAFGYNLHQSMS